MRRDIVSFKFLAHETRAARAFGFVRWEFFFDVTGGGQYLERANVERSIFRNFKILNIKITSDLIFLFANLFFYFFTCVNYSNTQNIW